MSTNENWYARGKAEADKGIPCGDRVVGIAIVVFNVVMVLYFSAHQRRSTGFFTVTFGTFEMIALYGVWVYWIVVAGLEAVLGQRLLSRLFDVFGGLIISGIFIIWLLVVFPFDFSFFADVLPEAFRFLAQWISNGVARVLLVLGIIVHFGAAIYTPIGYKFVDMERFKRD
jgi:hypothetical protein